MKELIFNLSVLTFVTPMIVVFMCYVFCVSPLAVLPLLAALFVIGLTISSVIAFYDLMKSRNFSIICWLIIGIFMV